ncbi:unnamed protein product [Acanthosepion pharaonis]|uniref:Uncharacterized protein n=1 Tax=Acanthosepion pharaonis TaxID=158019 RepID=A0A812C4H8_ACAPH|nr:unnamed protein product [Sepia pharaonis]
MDYLSNIYLFLSNLSFSLSIYLSSQAAVAKKITQRPRNYTMKIFINLQYLLSISYVSIYLSIYLSISFCSRPVAIKAIEPVHYLSILFLITFNVSNISVVFFLFIYINLFYLHVCLFFHLFYRLLLFSFSSPFFHLLCIFFSSSPFFHLPFHFFL